VRARERVRRHKPLHQSPPPCRHPSIALSQSPITTPSSSTQTTIINRDLDTGAQLATFKAAGGGGGGASGGGGNNACSGRGGLCAVGKGYLCSAQRHKDSVTLWAWHRDQPLHRCFVPERVTAVAASPDGALVAGGGGSGALYLWHAPTGRLLRSWPAHYRPVSALAFADGGNVLISGGDDALALCWAVADVADALPDAAPSALAAAGSGAAAATTTAPQQQQQQQQQSTFAHPRLEPMHTWSGHTLSVQAVHCSPSAVATGGGTTAVVATASADRTVRLWSLSTGRPLLTLAIPGGGAAATAVCLDPGEHSVFVGCADGAVYEASLSGGAGAEAAAAAGGGAGGGGAEGGGGGGASTAGGGATTPSLAIQLRRLPGGGHTKAVVALAVAPNPGDGGGDRLVSASEDGTARVWDLSSGGQCVRTFASPARAPIAAALALPTPAALAGGAGLMREAPRRAQPLAPLAKFSSSSSSAAAGGGGGDGAAAGGVEALPLILDGLAAGAARRDPLLADERVGGGSAAAALYAGVGALL
jgi:pre-rRNA-processing protein IPI3